MILELLVLLMALSFILIAIGVFRPEHTELSLIGFLFLFFLSLIIIGNDIQYKIGTDKTINNYYLNDTQPLQITNSTEISRDIYSSLDFGGTLSHSIGYWLAVCSVIGFIGVLLGLKSSWSKK